MFMYFIDNL